MKLEAGLFMISEIILRNSLGDILRTPLTPLLPLARRAHSVRGLPSGSWISPTVFQCKFQQKIRLGKSSASRL